MEPALLRIARIGQNPAFIRATSLPVAISLLRERGRVLECAHDLRAGSCLALSQRLTLVETQLQAGRAGDAADWLERLQIEQANAYLRALDGWDRGDFALTPAPWRTVFSMERRGYLRPADALRLESAVHTVYDLPLAIARAATLGHTRDARYATFMKWCSLPAKEGGGMLARLRIHGAAKRERAAWRDGLALRDADEGGRRAVFARIEEAALRMCREVRNAANPAKASAPTVVTSRLPSRPWRCPRIGVRAT